MPPSYLTFSLTDEDREALDRQARNFEDRFRRLKSLPKGRDREFADLGRLLEANGQNLQQLKKQVWFQKVWMLVSGEKGHLRDITINNLGKVQVGALKILRDLLEDSAADKEKLLTLFERVTAIKAGSNAQKTLLLRFNQKYEAQFAALWRQLRYVTWVTHIVAGLFGIALLICAMFGFVPSLDDRLRRAILGGGGLMGIGLLIIAIQGAYFRGRRRVPFRVGMSSAPSEPQERKLVLPAGTLDYLGLTEPLDRRVFKLSPHAKDLQGYVRLSSEEARVLFSIEYHLTQHEIDRRVGAERELAARWLERWAASIEETNHFSLVRDETTFIKGLDEIDERNLSREKRSILLFEAMLFRPYFELGADGPSPPKIDPDEEALRGEIRRFARALHCTHGILEDARATYEKSLKEIPPSHIWKKVGVGVFAAILVALTAGMAAPMIGAMIGGAFYGLAGIAAVNAGLALLGGGAIAAGGLGIAGGTVLLIGGGAVLGAGAGIGLTKLLVASEDLTMSQLAKMEAVVTVLLRPLPSAEELLAEALAWIFTRRDAINGPASIPPTHLVREPHGAPTAEPRHGVSGVSNVIACGVVSVV